MFLFPVRRQIYICKISPWIRPGVLWKEKGPEQVAPAAGAFNANLTGRLLHLNGRRWRAVENASHQRCGPDFCVFYQAVRNLVNRRLASSSLLKVYCQCSVAWHCFNLLSPILSPLWGCFFSRFNWLEFWMPLVYFDDIFFKTGNFYLCLFQYQSHFAR